MPAIINKDANMPFTGDINNSSPTPTGSQLRRPFMGGSMGGAYGPTGNSRPPKTPGMPGYGANAAYGGGNWAAPGGAGVPTPGGGMPPSGNRNNMPNFNKGGQAGFVPGGTAGGGNPTNPMWRPGERPGGGSPPNPAGGGGNAAGNPMNGMFGGFNPAQLTQQNGQWGMQGRGGNFQQLGANALQRWLAQQASQGGGGGMETPVPATPATPAMPAVPAGYLTAQQYDNNPAHNWFRQGEGAAGRPVDVNAYNQWFRNFGRAFDPTGWDRLYGGGMESPFSYDVGGG